MLAITWRSSFAFLILVGLSVSGKQAGAQAPTYVGTFAMTDGATDRCLTDAGYALGNPQPFTTNPWAAIPSQEWAFFLLPNGYYAIMNIKTTNFVEAAYDFGQPDGLVDEGAWNASLSQMWYFYPLGGNFYALVNLRTGQMLTDPNPAGVGGIGKSAALKTWTGNLNQWWYLYFLRK